MEKDLGIRSEVGYSKNAEMAQRVVPGGDEPEVRDDPRQQAVVAGQYHDLGRPGHALLVSLQQA